MSSATIFALSSGLGKAAVAVIRMSGPATRHALERLVGDVPPMRRASVRRLRDPETHEVLDEALVLFFPGPRSYTGEDTAEFQVHGGRAVVAAALAALGRIEGCRLAEPGEFTRRALENGKLDLTRVEGIADLIDAETPQQRRQALGQAAGRLAAQATEWRALVIEAMAEIEAELDFADEGDVEATRNHARLSAIPRTLAERLRSALDDGRRGERLRDGFTVVIAGPPNAGKSTLLNALAQRDVAIVSPFPGTTRDLVEVHLDLAGLPVVLIDTAGLRESTDPVEQMGMDRARARAEGADLTIWLHRWDDPSPPPAWVERCIPVASQIDSAPAGWIDGSESPTVSALSGSGLAGLLDTIQAAAAAQLGGEPALITRERHRTAIGHALSAIERANNLATKAESPELVAEELRMAARRLASLLGLVDVEQVLDALFRQFCIGK